MKAIRTTKTLLSALMVVTVLGACAREPVATSAPQVTETEAPEAAIALEETITPSPQTAPPPASPTPLPPPDVIWDTLPTLTVVPLLSLAKVTLQSRSHDMDSHTFDPSTNGRASPG
ncbi:MAG: hypothetical protein M1546_05890, partial [Chloroflexi bacterium]|nr:hypothetical protein [Chloroflexota bacterium]